MGKGDKKTKRGKIAIGSYGNSRRKKKRGTVITPKAAPEAVAEDGVAPKPRKTARKKTEG